MLSCSPLQYLLMILTVMSKMFSHIDGHELCGSNVPIDHESNRYYRSFKHLDSIGVLQCMEVCKRYKLCEKIHHSREQLTCDLMMTYAKPDNVTSLLAAQSLQKNLKSCSRAECLWNEVCVNMKNGSHVCLVQDVCPTNQWVPFNNKCYMFNRQEMTADDNLDYCESINAKMVRVDDLAVNNFLLSEMAKRELTTIWIAANDRAVEGEWVWGPGDIVRNANWINLEPNDLYGEDCVILEPMWYDVNCAAFLSYPVCEVPFNISF